MKSPDFSYYEALSIEDAIKFKCNDDESVFLAGGQSLIPALNMRLSSPSCLIDISKINELKNISIDDHFISIGASVTHSEVLQNKIILSFITGIIIGPITYYSGIFLDISFSKNLFFYFILSSIFWGLLLVFYSLSIHYFKK